LDKEEDVNQVVRNRVGFKPQYTVDNRRVETTYSMPLTAEGAEGQIDVTFRFRNREAAQASPPESFRGINVDFVVGVSGKGGCPLASALLEKEDLVTLQKLLLSALEHANLRRLKWFAEVGADSLSGPEAELGTRVR
jgi:hypothetical protein